eukprot:1156663-Pelagomonas_calceolata.AAC.3
MCFVVQHHPLGCTAASYRDIATSYRSSHCSSQSAECQGANKRCLICPAHLQHNDAEHGRTSAHLDNQIIVALKSEPSSSSAYQVGSDLV